jgi:opacity protein-like surface antigen
MKMKKLAVTFAVATVAFSALQAQAQSGGFQGLSLGLNAGMIASNTEITSGTSVLDGLGHISAVGSLQAAYGWAIGDAMVSVGATYNLNDVDGGELRTLAGARTAIYKARDAYSVYVEPGFKLNDRTLAFATLSYEAASAKAEDGAGVITKQDIQGTGYGFGLRTLLDKNMYVQVAVKQVYYDSERFPGDTADFKTRSTLGSVGVGYRFWRRHKRALARLQLRAWLICSESRP